MEKIPSLLKEMTNNGESTTVELKEAKKGLPKTLFETICSMLNRNGGHIFLGVNDDGDIIGVDSDSIKNIKKDFSNLCNNPSKIFPTVHLEVKEYEIDDETINASVFKVLAWKYSLGVLHD